MHDSKYEKIWTLILFLNALFTLIYTPYVVTFRNNNDSVIEIILNTVLASHIFGRFFIAPNDEWGKAIVE